MDKPDSSSLYAVRGTRYDSLGHGIGLRSEHFNEILETKPKVDWFEAISENFMDTAGRPLRILEKIRADYPIGLHGTSLSIGSANGLNQTYLEKLKKLVERIQPQIISDHLCWSEYADTRLFDLLPLPFTEESLRLVVGNVQKLQEFLGRQIVLENVSAYISFKHSAMPEWEFLNEVARQSGCGILLDVNNIYVNSFNHGFDPREYLNAIDSERVMQYHISGHTDRGKFLFDTHTGDVIKPVWDLYSAAVKRFGDVSCLIEWDTEIGSLNELLALNEKSREVAKNGTRNTEHEKRSAEYAMRKKMRVPCSVFRVPDLNEIQSMFSAELLRKGKTDLDKILNPQANDPGIERLEVYAEGYPARIREALLEAYPAILKVLGDAVFSDLALQFGKAQFFQHYNLNQVAGGFPEFLKNIAWNEKLPFLYDLAELELAVQRAFHAEALTPASPQDFADKAGLEGENLILRFQPHVFGVRSHWPILDIWNSRNQPTAEIKIQLEGRPQAVLIYRAGEKVICQKADPLEIAVLSVLKEGEPLGKAFDVLTEVDDMNAVQKWFSGWLLNGLVASFQLATDH